jgi:general secretion pathway protein G
MHSYGKISGRTMRRFAMRGFTLIELLLVVAILSILAAVVLPKLGDRTKQARLSAAKADISNMGTALEAFEVDCGRLPTTDEGLNALVQQPGNVQNWNKAGYLNKGVPKDPWDHDYVYRCPGQQNPNGYDLYSFGPDGQDGGGDDIVNWTQK